MHLLRHAVRALAMFPQSVRSNYSFFFANNRLCHHTWLYQKYRIKMDLWLNCVPHCIAINRAIQYEIEMEISLVVTFESFVCIEHWQQLSVKWNQAGSNEIRCHYHLLDNFQRNAHDFFVPCIQCSWKSTKLSSFQYVNAIYDNIPTIVLCWKYTLLIGTMSCGITG